MLVLEISKKHYFSKLTFKMLKIFYKSLKKNFLNFISYFLFDCLNLLILLAKDNPIKICQNVWKKVCIKNIQIYIYMCVSLKWMIIKSCWKSFNLKTPQNLSTNSPRLLLKKTTQILWQHNRFYQLQHHRPMLAENKIFFFL